MFAEPLAGWREVAVRATKTKVDWAIEDGAACWKAATPTCEKVILVCDNLNTHTKGAFYEAFEPERARRLVRRHRVLLHAQARQLAEHRRERIEFADAPVRRRPPLRRHRDAADGNRRLVIATSTHRNAASIGK